MPTSGIDRGSPLFAPVVVNMITGRPAINPGTVSRPSVRAYSTLSTGYSVRWKSHAPGPLAAIRCVSRCAAFAGSST